MPEVPSHKILIIVETQHECDVIKARDININILVAKTYAYTHKKAKKELRSLNLSDFNHFNYREELKEIFTLKDIERVTVLAPHNTEGLSWMSHWAWYADTNSNDLDNSGIAFEFCTYTCLAFEYGGSNSVSSSYLCSLFRVHVFNTITSILFYLDVSMPVTKHLLGSARSALSLGMVRLLSVLASLDNPRSLRGSTDNQDAELNTTSKFTFDSYDAPKLVFRTEDNGVFHAIQPHDGLSFVPFAKSIPQGVTSYIPTVTDTNLLDALDPYIYCLTEHLNLNSYLELQRKSVLSVGASPELPTYHNHGLTVALRQHFNYLTQSGILCGSEYANLQQYFDAAVPIHQGTWAVAGSSTEISDSFDYSVLYSRYSLNTLIRLAVSPTHEAKRSPYSIAQAVAYDAEINTISHKLPMINTSVPYAPSWHRLLDDSTLLKKPLDSRPRSSMQDEAEYSIEFEVINNPKTLAHIFNLMWYCYGYKHSYTYSLLKILDKRGYLNIIESGVRITGYGYAYSKAFDHRINAEKCDNVLSIAEVLHNSNTDNQKHTELASAFDDRLEDARELLDTVKQVVKTSATYTITRKSKSGKKRKYKLVFDRKAKTAVFKSRSGKMLPVWSKTKSRTSEHTIGESKIGFGINESKLTALPSYVLKSTTYGNPCPECGARIHGFSIDAQGQLKLKCQCSKLLDAPFITLKLPTSETKEQKV